VKRVYFLSVNVEPLILGNGERLICAILQGQNHLLRRRYMEDPSRHFLDGGNGLGCCCYRDGPLKLHAWLQVVDAELLAVDIDFGALRNIVEVPK